MAEGRVGGKLGSPCKDGETEAARFLKSHGEFATGGMKAVGSGREVSHFPPKRSVARWQQQVRELSGG